MKILSGLVPRSQTGWILVGGGLVSLAVIAGVLVGPVRSHSRILTDSVAIREKLLARQLSIVAPPSRDAVQKAYAEFGSVLAKRGSTAEVRASMLAEIERTASEAGVVLSSTKPREPRIEKYSEEYLATVDVEGSTSNTMSFLHGIESSPQMLRVESMVLDAKGGGEQGVLRGNVVISRVVTL